MAGRAARSTGGNMGAVARTPLQGQGTQEQAWLHCDWLWQQPTTSATALCSGHDRMVVVAPHPDDEILGCGGLLHHAAGQGIDVSVVAVTDGEACYPGEPWWTPERLRSARRAELAAALGELGIPVGSIFHLGIADGAVSAHEQGLEGWLQQYLQPRDLVLAPWRFDGHPDHEAAGRAGCAPRGRSVATGWSTRCGAGTGLTLPAHIWRGRFRSWSTFQPWRPQSESRSRISVRRPATWWA